MLRTVQEDASDRRVTIRYKRPADDLEFLLGCSQRPRGRVRDVRSIPEQLFDGQLPARHDLAAAERVVHTENFHVGVGGVNEHLLATRIDDHDHLGARPEPFGDLRTHLGVEVVGGNDLGGQVGRTGGLLNFTKWGLREWFILTYIMGAIFIGGQALEYAELIHEGVTIPSSAYGSMFYLTTGFHGLHVTGGLIAFLFVLGRTYLARRFTHEQAVTAIVVSYYWHFVDVVWIGLFFTIYVIK